MDRNAGNDLENDIRDGADELKHRGAAVGEAVKREVAGDQMSPTQRVASNLKEAGHDLAAGFDKTKRETRDETR